MPTNNPTPLSVAGEIREGYLRYFDTAFWLRDAELMAERRRLLEAEGVVFTDALIEPLLPYESSVPLAEVLNRSGYGAALAGTVAKMLFGADKDADFRLRAHQAEALSTSISKDTALPRNVVVTAGTGSGKTECFLLPLLARLLAERESWGDPAPLHRWWDKSLESENWRHCRTGSTREAAVRSIILYPTNALVEDQVARLRRALNSISTPGAPAIFFGR